MEYLSKNKQQETMCDESSLVLLHTSGGSLTGYLFMIYFTLVMLIDEKSFLNNGLKAGRGHHYLLHRNGIDDLNHETLYSVKYYII